MAETLKGVFTSLIKIRAENTEQYYLKTSIDEENTTIDIQLTNLKSAWTGKLDQDQIQVLARKFPRESKDSFYSHTHIAFSRGNQCDKEGRNYVFTCKQLDKNRSEFIWKEKIEDLNSLKTVGTIELREKSHSDILGEMFDYSINEIDHQRSMNEQRQVELRQSNAQLNKALETIRQTVDLKEQLEGDLYRKFVIVLNEKKAQLAKLKQQLEAYEHDHTSKKNGHQRFDHYDQSLNSPNASASLSTVDEVDYPNNKRSRRESDEGDTTDDEEQRSSRPTSTTPKKPHLEYRQDSALDLGNDQMDYRVSTISKHHQRRKDIPPADTISTRPFVKQVSAHPTPSLPEESQTTDDLLNKI